MENPHPTVGGAGITPPNPAEEVLERLEEGLDAVGEVVEESFEAVGESVLALDDRVGRARASVETALNELVSGGRGGDVEYLACLWCRCAPLRLEEDIKYTTTREGTPETDKQADTLTHRVDVGSTEGKLMRERSSMPHDEVETDWIYGVLSNTVGALPHKRGFSCGKRDGVGVQVQRALLLQRNVEATVSLAAILGSGLGCFRGIA